jgi:acyl-CoA thioesterase-1
MKTKSLLPLICSVCLLLTSTVIAQKKIVIMGSSTAVGYGATSYQTSWAGLLTDYYNSNTADGKDTTVYNIAVAGYNMYLEMPTRFVPPSGRPAPDVNANVTKALGYYPDVVFINLPSNDVGMGCTIKETMDNFRLMYNAITAGGAKCFITTSQPRNDYSDTQRQLLRDMRDSIINQFGLFSINFWDDLVTLDGLNMLRADRKDPSGDIHPNDLGHSFLFARVKDANPFGIIVLPITLTGFTALVNDSKVFLKWHMEHYLPNANFVIERSFDGSRFEVVTTSLVNVIPQLKNYSFIDNSPLPNKSFYRIKILEPGETILSNTIAVANKVHSFTISSFYKDDFSKAVVANVLVSNPEMLKISLLDAGGNTLIQKNQTIYSSGKISLPISNLPQGQYFFSITDFEKKSIVKSFIK